MSQIKLFVFYVPGLDARHVDSDHAPYLTSLMDTHPRAVVTSFPSMETFPTIVTGLLPHDHGFWQVTLRDDVRRSWLDRAVDALPDPVTTTAQLVLYRLTESGDLPTIPPRRRRRLEFRREKIRGRGDTAELLAKLRGIPSLFTILGEEGSRYRFSGRLDDRSRLLDELVDGTRRLEFLELYALDILTHWRLDTPATRRRYYREVDDLVRQFHDKCRSLGVTMVVLTDHGQEPVRGTVDLRRSLRDLGLGEDEYTYYMEVQRARFWFHSDRARKAVGDLLRSTAHGDVLTVADFRKYGIRFPDDRHGETYFLLHPGWVFFPHDFYHPLANLYFGLKDRQQRRRLRNPRYLAYHGYGSPNESDNGFMVVLDRSVRRDREPVALVDIAPSLLDLLGHDVPDRMTGTPRFRRAAD